MPQQQQEFLFVNTGNPSKGEHKISTTGRAFVIRKARASHGWSTKSKTKRCGSGIATGSRSTSRAASSTTQAATRVCPSSNEDSPNMLPSLPGSGECGICLRSQEDCACTAWSPSTAAVPVPASRFSNAIDPFRVMSLDLDHGDTRLLAYCKWTCPCGCCT